MAKTTIQAELPPESTALAQRYVEQGWAANFDEVLVEALRRFLESHPADVTEAFVISDVQWGLHGTE